MMVCAWCCSVHWYITDCNGLPTEVTVSVNEPTYTVAESDGYVEVSYSLNREAVRDVTFTVVNIDGNATGGGVGELTFFNPTVVVESVSNWS